MRTHQTRRSPIIVAGVLLAVLFAALALAACGGGEPSLAESPLPTPTMSGTLVFENVVTPGFGGNGDIYMVNLDGSGLKALAEAPDWADHPSWSPDGRTIVWAAYPGGKTILWVMNADGTGKKSLATSTLTGNQAVWSPDGSQIAFFRDDKDASGIWVVNADGSGPRQVTRAADTVDLAPAWSPDGRIFFLRSSKVFVVNPDGSGLQQVTTGVNVGEFGLSPDGKTLAVHDYSNDRIVAIPVEGGGSPVTLLDRPSRFVPSGIVGKWTPVWSPDGKALVLAASSWGSDTGPRLYIVNANGSGLSAVPGVKAAMDPSWRPE